MYVNVVKLTNIELDHGMVVMSWAFNTRLWKLSEYVFLDEYSGRRNLNGLVKIDMDFMLHNL